MLNNNKKQETQFFGTKCGNANSIAAGYATETTNYGEIATGILNKSTKGDNPNSPEGVVGDPKATLFSVGCGTKEERKNALEVKGDGSVIISGKDGSDVNIADLAEKLDQPSVDLSEYVNKNELAATESAIQKQIATKANAQDVTNAIGELQDSINNIAITGGASTAAAVTFDNTASGMTAVNAQGAIEELNAKKLAKANIAQELGNSEELVMSQKAVSDKLKGLSTEIIYDVSAHNNNAVFESLQALLSSSNLDTLIPPLVRRGGMSIKFIQGSEHSSDNKYLQYRLMSDTFSTTESDWQGVDDEPTTGSQNFVESRGIYGMLYNERNTKQGYLAQDLTDTIIDNPNWIVSDYIPVSPGVAVDVYVVKTNEYSDPAAILEYKSNKTVNNFMRCNGYTTNPFKVDVKADSYYLRISYPKDADFVIVKTFSNTYTVTKKDDFVVIHTGERRPIELPGVLFDVYKQDDKAYKIINGTLTEEAWNGVMYVKLEARAGDIIVFPRGYYNYKVYPQFLKVGNGTLTPMPSICSGLGFVADEDATYIAMTFSYYPSDGCYVYTKNPIKYAPTDDKTWYDTSITLDLPDAVGNKSGVIYTDIPKGNYLTVKIELLSGTLDYLEMFVNGYRYRNNKTKDFGVVLHNPEDIKAITTIARDSSSARVKITFRSTIKDIPLSTNNLMLDDGAKIVDKLNSRNVIKRLQFVHISDPHGKPSVTDEILDYVDDGNADFTIITGDLVNDEFSDPFYADYLITKTKPCYVVLGNHDVFKATSLQDRFDKFIEPLNEHNNLTGNTKTYYSVNYTTKGVKCIILDEWDGIEIGEDSSGFDGSGYNMSDAQVTWLINELTNALSNNLDVAIFVHELPVTERLVDIVEGWTDSIGMQWGRNGEFLRVLIDAFMHVGNSGSYDITNPQTGTRFTGEFNGYGQFVGWFGGHSHWGMFGYPVEHPRQFYFTSSRPYASNYDNDMDGRLNIPIRNSHASINHVVIDAKNKIVSLVRIGVKDTKYGVEAAPFSISYQNHIYPY